MPSSDQGVSRDRYLLIPRVLTFITRADSVLLLKGAPGKRLWAGKYNGVGGHLERGEDVLSAARRELLEETGLVADLRLSGIVIVDAGQEIGIGMYILSGPPLAGELRASSEGTPEWVEFSRLGEYPLVEDVALFLYRIRLALPGSPPFSARSYYDEHDRLRVIFAETGG